MDFSDFYATFAELAGAIMPKDFTFDSRSFMPQLRGGKGTPREWIFVQLGSKWYVRDKGFKLTRNGELFDMSDAPFIKKLVDTDLKNKTAAISRKRLQDVLDKLNPAGGITEFRPEKGNQKRKRMKLRVNQL